MSRSVLHVLSQRPLLTGSGITLDAMVRLGAERGWDQSVVVGTPARDPFPPVGGLASNRIHPLVFESEALPFALPGMSDVMPYPSSVFSSLDPAQLSRYRGSWRHHLRRVVETERPGLVHVHHAWIVASELKSLFPGLPVVTHCHATGLRQMELCPHVAEEVKRGLIRNDLFLVLHEGDGARLSAALELPPGKTRVVGAGYREDLFHGRGAPEERGEELLYVGKYSRAKGVPWLLDALVGLVERGRAVRLHVAGGGSGDEARELEERMRSMSGQVVLDGSLSQAELADLMRRCAVCVLPSFYEGLPLVLVEAAACGCRLVATRLDGVEGELAPRLGAVLDLVTPPRLVGLDTPVEEDLPAFVEGLEAAIARSLDLASQRPVDRLAPEALESFTWRATFERVEEAWIELLSSGHVQPS